MKTRTVLLAVAAVAIGSASHAVPAKAGFFEQFGLALSHIGELAEQKTHPGATKPKVTPVASEPASVAAATPAPDETAVPPKSETPPHQ